jgi:isopropylmalate/homocitrate/citramalate synthase
VASFGAARIVNENLFLTELVEARRPPQRVTFNDVTLREGEQSENVSFSLEAKIDLALALEAAGVPQIQIGYPGRFERDAQAATEVGAALSTARVEVVALAFVDDWESEIDASLASGAPIVNIVHRASERLHRVLGVSRDDVRARARSAIERAVAGGVAVSFTPSDSTRADPRFLVELWKTAAEAGASRVYVADSMGAATPELVALLVRRAGELTGLPVGVHCHNDFGLVVGNTVAGVMAGASCVDVAVNGLGDRAGNAPLEEVAAALELLYGVPTGLDLRQLTPLSERFSVASARNLPPNKPVTGSAVFAHVLPTHVAAMERDPRAIQPYEAEIVGNVGRLQARAP